MQALGQLVVRIVHPYSLLRTSCTDVWGPGKYQSGVLSQNQRPLGRQSSRPSTVVPARGRRSLVVLLASLTLLLGLGAARGVAQETPVEPAPSAAPAPVPLGPLPPPQERLLTPIPQPFDWISRDVRPNPLLESLLSLRAQPRRLFLAISLAEQYSDNFSQGGTDDRREEYRTSLNLGTTYRFESGRSFVTLANTVSANYDARAEDSEVGFANLSLNAGHQVPRLSLALSESFVRDDDTGQASAAGIRQGRRTFWRNNISPQMQYAVGRRTSFSLAYTNTLVVSEGGGGNDSITHAVSTGFDHRFGRRLSGNVNYGFTFDDTSGAGETRIHDTGINFGYIIDRRTGVDWNVFGSLTDRSAGRVDSWTYGGTVGLRRQLTPFFGVFAALGASVFDQEDDNPEVRLNWQVSMDGALPFSRRTSLTLNSQQTVDNTTGNVDNVGIVLSQSVTATLNHVVTRSVQTAFFVSFTRTEQLEGAIGTTESAQDREDKFWRAGANASVALTRILSLSLSYLYQRRDSNLPGADFEENQVTLSLSSAFSVL